MTYDFGMRSIHVTPRSFLYGATRVLTCSSTAFVRTSSDIVLPCSFATTNAQGSSLRARLFFCTLPTTATSSTTSLLDASSSSSDAGTW